ncbi:MAG: hypothetical protein K0S23_3426 [Fluviicola sp.]|jgi:hypothetical protein|uniref:hypothetical protein n=1 Tax=Fluviicola sp. TaxID=1917219 RepID=UPI00262C9937|nr:hypothetical protein [Fluviicola sp.]MDF3029119.1 hypothetical protein [Fluviicola sp.]
MNSIFLRAKHWQLFVPLVAIPFVTFIIFGFAVAIILLGHPSKGPEDTVWIFYFFPLLFILCGFIQFAWFWNVITKLNPLVPTRRGRFPMRRIKLFFFIPIIYFCLVPFFVAFVVNTTAISNPGVGQMLQLGILGFLVFILHFFSIFCILHTIYFAAKTIRSAELKRNASFSNFAGDFFLIWIFPVGIWFIQPRINALLNKANDSSTSEELMD